MKGDDLAGPRVAGLHRRAVVRRRRGARSPARCRRPERRGSTRDRPRRAQQPQEAAAAGARHRHPHQPTTPISFHVSRTGVPVYVRRRGSRTGRRRARGARTARRRTTWWSCRRATTSRCTTARPARSGSARWDARRHRWPRCSRSARGGVAEGESKRRMFRRATIRMNPATSERDTGSRVGFLMTADLDAIFKAYDVRGVYPDQIDESVARGVGNAFVAFTGAPRVLVGRDTRPSSEPLVAAFIEGATLAGADVVDLGMASTDLVYFASGHLDAPGRDVHGESQPCRSTTGSSCAAQAPRRSARRRGSLRSRLRSRPGCSSGPRTPGRSSSAICSRRVRRPRPLVRRPRCAATARVSSPTPRTASAGSSCPPRSPACRSTRRCSSASSTARSRTILPIRSSPRTSRTSSATMLEASADVGLAFDGDADRVFLVDDRAQPLSGSLTTRRSWQPRSCVASRPTRPGRSNGRAQPHLLEGRPRDRARARRHAGAHACRPLVHQAGDGRDGRHLRRRALRPLLLPRQLPRRLRPHRGARRARDALARRRAALGAARSRSSATPRPGRSTAASTIRLR